MGSHANTDTILRQLLRDVDLLLFETQDIGARWPVAHHLLDALPPLLRQLQQQVAINEGALPELRTKLHELERANAALVEENSALHASQSATSPTTSKVSRLSNYLQRTKSQVAAPFRKDKHAPIKQPKAPNSTVVEPNNHNSTASTSDEPQDTVSRSSHLQTVKVSTHQPLASGEEVLSVMADYEISAHILEDRAEAAETRVRRLEDRLVAVGNQTAQERGQWPIRNQELMAHRDQLQVMVKRILDEAPGFLRSMRRDVTNDKEMVTLYEMRLIFPMLDLEPADYFPSGSTFAQDSMCRWSFYQPARYVRVSFTTPALVATYDRMPPAADRLASLTEVLEMLLEFMEISDLREPDYFEDLASIEQNVMNRLSIRDSTYSPFLYELFRSTMVDVNPSPRKGVACWMAARYYQQFPPNAELDEGDNFWTDVELLAGLLASGDMFERTCAAQLTCAIINTNNPAALTNLRYKLTEKLGHDYFDEIINPSNLTLDPISLMRRLGSFLPDLEAPSCSWKQGESGCSELLVIQPPGTTRGDEIVIYSKYAGSTSLEIGMPELRGSITDMVMILVDGSEVPVPHDTPVSKYLIEQYSDVLERMKYKSCNTNEIE